MMAVASLCRFRGARVSALPLVDRNRYEAWTLLRAAI
jgi:hypothetical protein